MELVKVSMAVAEKVGLPNYSNVDIGPAVVERLVENTPEAIQKGLAECLLYAQEIVFSEAEEVRRRGKPTLEQALNVVAPGVSDLTETDALRLHLANVITDLIEAGKPHADRSEEARICGNKIQTKLVGLGVENPRSPSEALAVLPVEKVPDLERFLETLKEGLNGATA